MTCTKCPSLCASRTQIVEPDLPEFEGASGTRLAAEGACTSEKCASTSVSGEADSMAVADRRHCRVLVIGEAPGADEDTQGKGFVGRAGRTLHALLEAHGLRRGFDYGCANIVRCRPPDNRRPTMQEIVHCLPLLAETIDRAQPRAVITVGETATRGLTGIVGLWVSIKALREHDHDPRKAEMICPPEIKPVWPHGALLVPIPHTSPLAWNRNAPDGRKWAEVGAEQVRRMLEML